MKILRVLLTIITALLSLVAVLRTLRARFLRQPAQEGGMNIVAVMDGVDRSFIENNYTGGRLRAIMGGARVDLRNLTVRTKPAVIDATVLFGGAEIVVPSDWTVRIEATATLGGLDDLRHNDPSGDAEPDLVLRGRVLMGGLAITSDPTHAGG